MQFNFDQQHVMVSGGSKGIGLACAKAFFNEGAFVTIISRNQSHLNQAIMEISDQSKHRHVHAVAANLSDANEALEALDLAEKHFGPVAVLINSSGAAKRVGPDDLTPQAWQASMDAKFYPYIHLMDPVIKRMAQQGIGSIINIIGHGGKIAKPVHISGGSANAALMLASNGLAAAYASRGVRVNAINPGITLTGRLDGLIEAQSKQTGKSKLEVLADFTNDIPMGRLANPEEIAQVALFLASPLASYVTANIITMDGAMYPII
jgi:NAD(P)-dependent dehydrogenase (short-subunit alcohol dehydrogenase family)